ncbi:MAG TPA: 3-dehydroquinate synthase family protein [Acidimicrobiales bacterium]
MIRVPVPLGERAYDVLVGAGAVAHLAEVLPASARRVAIVTQTALAGVELLSGREEHLFVIGDGEEHKSLSTVERVCRAMTNAGFTRNDAVVGLGGGLVTDVAGFVASVYYRGVAVVHVPTTLLAMVDAAVGGKTGVNLPEGKNLVGTFWQPTGVLCDTDLLSTLPPREWACGHGEMAKYHFLTGDDLLALPLDERIARCVAIKADVVAADEREGGGRALLNYGHTLAHALEVAGRFDLRHGEAVAIGLVYAAEVARLMERIDATRVARHREVVHAYGLSADLPPGLDHAEVLTLMARDKKALDGYTLVLDGHQGVEVVAGIEPRVLEAALAGMDAARMGP